MILDDLNFQLTPHFSAREFVCGTDDFLIENLGNEKDLFIEMVEAELTDSILDNARLICLMHENIRELAGGYPIFNTCGFRPKAWDLHRGRSGKSQHVDGLAMDTRHSKMPLRNYFYLVNNTYAIGGRAIHPEANFVHLDAYFTKQQKKRTWNY